MLLVAAPTVVTHPSILLLLPPRPQFMWPLLQVPSLLVLWEQGLLRFAESFPLPNSLELLAHAEGLQCCALLSATGMASLIPLVAVLTKKAPGACAWCS